MREWCVINESVQNKFNNPDNGIYACTAKMHLEMQGLTDIGSTHIYLGAMPTYSPAYLKNMNEFIQLSEQASDLHYQISMARVKKGYWEVIRRKEEAKKQGVAQRKKSAKFGGF
jgi:hypothetical protein